MTYAKYQKLQRQVAAVRKSEQAAKLRKEILKQREDSANHKQSLLQSLAMVESGIG